MTNKRAFPTEELEELGLPHRFENHPRGTTIKCESKGHDDWNEHFDLVFELDGVIYQTEFSDPLSDQYDYPDENPGYGDPPFFYSKLNPLFECTIVEPIQKIIEVTEYRPVDDSDGPQAPNGPVVTPLDGGGKIEQVFHPNGQLQYERYTNVDGKPHRTDGPASRRWNAQGVLIQEKYRIDDEAPKTQAPVTRRWYDSGQIREELYNSASSQERLSWRTWHENGNLKHEAYDSLGNGHNSQKPSYKEWYENGNPCQEIWRKNSSTHREGGPAKTEWYENGQKKRELWLQIGFGALERDELGHRTDGPSYQKWHENGQLHEAIYSVKGKKHRTDGPAWCVWDENGQVIKEKYYVNGAETVNQPAEQTPTAVPGQDKWSKFARFAKKTIEFVAEALDEDPKKNNNQKKNDE